MASWISHAIFVVETVAHLQGREQDLLPIANNARIELNEIFDALRDLTEYAASIDVNPDLISAARAALAKLKGE